MIYVIDIDGVICSEDTTDMSLRTPYKKRIEYINSLYDQGHVICFFTSRGMRSTNNDQIASDKKYRKFTEDQLEQWGVKYHSLHFGKPNADVYVDNLNQTLEQFFKDI